MAIEQYTIGRDANNTVHITDESQRVSRTHATLTVISRNKIYITDHSTNGTFVNGVKISSGSEYPVQRGDTISFASVVDLDWDTIPKRGGRGVIILIIAISLLIVGAGVGTYLYMNNQSSAKSSGSGSNETVIDLRRDSINQEEKRQKLEDEEAEKRAEIRRAEEEAKRVADEAAAKKKAEAAAIKATKVKEEQKSPTLIF